MNTHVSTLPNGLRVVTECRPGLETVSVGVWVNTGARHEPAQFNGISHFLEHMLFKGTGKRSAKDIVMDIEMVGGHLNAYTTRDTTTYYARILRNDLPLAMDVLSDIILNSVCDPKEITREKDVILQEIGQANDTPDDIIFDHLQKAAYGDSALGRTILGEPDIISAFTQADLTDYLHHNYVAANMVISAVGNLDHTAFVQMVEDHFGGLRTGIASKIAPTAYLGDHQRETRDLDQLHMALAWPAFSYHADEYYALQVYSTILGGGMSSRLFQEVRENRGLAYSVYSFTSSHEETGVLGVYAGTGTDMVQDLQAVINSEMESLTQGSHDWEFRAAVAQLKASLMMGLEATTSRMEQLGRQLLVYNRVIPVQEMIEKVDAVSLEDVRKVSNTIFSCANSSSIMIGPENLKTNT